MINKKEKNNQEENYLKENFDSVLDSLNDGFLLIGLTGKILKINKALLAMGGYNESDVLGKNAMKLVSIFPAASLKKIAASFLDAVKGVPSDRYNLDAKTKDGIPKIIEVSNSLIKKNGKTIGIVVIARDVTEIKKDKSKIKENELFLSKIINTVSDPIFVKDVNHRWVVFNDAFCKFMGRAKEKLIGKSDYDFFPKTEAKVFWDKDEQVFKTGQENINEENFTDAKGVTHTIITKKNIHNDGHDKYLVGVITDITELKQIENLLEKQKKEQQVILDSIPAWVFYKDKNNNFIRVNQAFADAMGLAKEKIEGKSMSVFYPKDQAEAFWQDDKDVIKSGVPKRNIIESANSLKGKMWVQTDKIPYLDENGKIIGIIGFSLDITKKKEIQAALEESELKFRSLADAAKDAIVMMNNQSKISFWNKAAELIFGYKASEAIGQDLHYLIASEKQHREKRDNINKFNQTGQSDVIGKIIELPVKNKQGKVFMVELSVSKTRINDEWFSVGIMRDVTERKKAEKQLQEKISELEKINKLMVDRELKMVELKDEIKRLKK